MLTKRVVVPAVAVALLALMYPITASGYEPTWVPAGINVGDTYHLVFVTSTATHDATSTNIGTYDAIVDGLGDAMTGSPYGDVTWLCIGSTSTEDAITHAPISGPVYLLQNDIKVADNSGDMWDTTLDAAINIDDAGNTGISADVWTGTGSNGLRHPTTPLGAADCISGETQFTDGQWVNSNTRAKANTYRLYGISEALTYTVPEPGTITLTLLSLAGGGAALRRRRRKRGGK